MTKTILVSLALFVCWSGVCLAEGEMKLQGKYTGKSPDGNPFSVTFDGKKAITVRLSKEQYWTGTYDVKLRQKSPHHINFQWKKGTIKFTKGRFQGIFTIESSGQVRLAIGSEGDDRPTTFGKKAFVLKRE
ncbi:MAG: hypothetical protein ACFCD0_18930 [Gemmataceae bacterium]